MRECCPLHTGRLAKYSPQVMESMIRMYCEGEPNNCARYVVMSSLGKENVPADLTPNDMVRAKAVIKECQKKYLAARQTIND